MIFECRSSWRTMGDISLKQLEQLYTDLLRPTFCQFPSWHCQADSLFWSTIYDNRNTHSESPNGTTQRNQSTVVWPWKELADWKSISANRTTIDENWLTLTMSIWHRFAWFMRLIHATWWRWRKTEKLDEVCGFQVARHKSNWLICSQPTCTHWDPFKSIQTTGFELEGRTGTSRLEVPIEFGWTDLLAARIVLDKLNNPLCVSQCATTWATEGNMRAQKSSLMQNRVW